jgi:RNA polymerase sigma factor (sigma-70 family)
MANGPLTPILRHVRRIGTAAAPAADGDRQLLERFTAHGDTTAFAALVRRHGPMVLGVCRRVLRDPHAADDAFQATFLLLVRKAGSLRRPDALGPWLYGVARRTALKTRTLLARRRARERPLVDRPVVPADDLTWRDLRPILDDLIAGLPAKERGPVVLCDLEGLTQSEAARQLGCPPGTVATRLTRARQRLRARLVSRGIAPAAGVLAAGLVPESLAEAVPAVLVRATVKAVGGEVSGGVAVIVKGVIGAMLMERIKVALLVTAGFGAAGSGAGVVTYRALAQEPAARPAPADAAKPAPEAQKTTTVRPMPAEEPHRVGVDRPMFWTSENFSVLAPSGALAEAFAKKAESSRRELARLWLGEEMPRWSKRCHLGIRLKLGGGAGSATEVKYDGSGGYAVLSMKLEGDLERMLNSALPHEMTHTVLAHYFRAQPPRWADEGAAMMSEDEQVQQNHDLLCRKLLSGGEKFPLRRLFSLKMVKNLPPGVINLDAEGYSVTRFLVERKDRATFLAFVKQGMAGDWDKAVREKYDFATVEALEEAWLAQLKKTPAPEPLPPANVGFEKPDANLTPPLQGPPPYTTLAYVDQQGRLALRNPIVLYRERREMVPSGGADRDYVPVVHAEPAYAGRWQLYEPGQVEAYDTEGQFIDAKKLAELLAKETAVLMATDGKKVDPFYLQVIKPGTVVLVPLIPKPSQALPASKRTTPPLGLSGN